MQGQQRSTMAMAAVAQAACSVRALRGAVCAAIASAFVTGCSGGLHVRPEATRLAVDESAIDVPSGTEHLRVDTYLPHSAGRHPAALLLHGSGGVHAIVGSSVTRYARALAEQGIAAFVVHYFDGTGDFTADDSIERANYFHWVGNVRDVVTWAAARTDVQPRRLSLMGQSLGAWLAVGVGATDQRVFRMVLMGGGLEPFLVDSIHRLPPTLLLHGALDDVVPLSDARQLQSFMQQHGFRVSLQVYPGEEHSFGDSAAVDALVRTVRFIAPPRTPIRN